VLEFGGRHLLCWQITCHPKRWRWGRGGRRAQGRRRGQGRWRLGDRNNVYRLIKNLGKLLSLQTLFEAISNTEILWGGYGGSNSEVIGRKLLS
jgi:hypothetical protein